MDVAVALSGGADSLMSLLLLLESGARVLGVHARFADSANTNNATVEESLAALCARHGADFRALDLRAEFDRLVIEPFVRDYLDGRTPNPCSACNPAIKFGVLMDQALTLGARAFATGHYARLEPRQEGPTLFRGLDPAKDQSYFLSRVPRQRFTQALFPLAGWTKIQVHEALRQRGVTVPETKESQEICFIPDDYKAFLRRRRRTLPPPGPITLADGTVLGRHHGLWNHTMGQRKGLGIAYKEPLYVTAKDASRNRLVVGPRDETLSTGCLTGPPNLLADMAEWPDEILVQTIYRQQPHPARVEHTPLGLCIRFTQPRPLPAPGQTAALYAPNGQILAGAVITESTPDAT